MSSIDCPSELKAFHQAFSKMAYGQDASRVFDDLLEYMISQFSFDYNWKPQADYRVDNPAAEFWKIVTEIIHVMDHQLKSKHWYDPFGSYYESAIASHARRSNAGQFFTPVSVVDFQVQIVGDESIIGAGEAVNDPACGSGRYLIAFHSYYPGNYCSGEDIDRTCALMCVCNFILHGVNGEVVWHDSLDPNSFYQAWRIKPQPDLGGIPYVAPMEQMDTLCFRHWLTHLSGRNDTAKAEMPKQMPAKTQQLVLF